jgi:hypothetical protein
VFTMASDSKGPERRSKYPSTDGATNHIEFLQGKKGKVDVVEKVESSSSSTEEEFAKAVKSPKDLITEIIEAKDDPTLNPWTFRTWFLGMSLGRDFGVSQSSSSDRNWPCCIQRLYYCN